MLSTEYANKRLIPNRFFIIFFNTKTILTYIFFIFSNTKPLKTQSMERKTNMAIYGLTGEEIAHGSRPAIGHQSPLESCGEHSSFASVIIDSNHRHRSVGFWVNLEAGRPNGYHLTAEMAQNPPSKGGRTRPPPDKKLQ